MKPLKFNISGFWDPAGISRDLTQAEFKKLQESEIKHSRIAMLAVLGVLVGESGFSLFDGIAGPGFDVSWSKICSAVVTQ